MSAMREVIGLLRIQAGLALVLAGVVAGFFGYAAGVAVLAGGLVLVSGVLLQAWISLRNLRRAPLVIVRLHFIAETAKLLWSVLLFFLLILWQPGFGLWFIVGYAVPALTYWLVLVIKPKRGNK